MQNSFYIERQEKTESNARSYPRKFPCALAKAQGSWVEDVEGNRYLDFLCGAGTLALGHNDPEVNAANRNNTTVVTDNGVYSAVNIDIDHPEVTTEPKVYNYPEAEEIVTYGRANLNRIELPQGMPISYEAYAIYTQDAPDEAEEVETVEVPAPNYTTAEAEKGIENIEEDYVEGRVLLESC